MQVKSYTEAGIYVNYTAEYTPSGCGVEESIEITEMSFRIDPDRSAPISDALKDAVAKAILEYVEEECRARRKDGRRDLQADTIARMHDIPTLMGRKL